MVVISTYAYIVLWLVLYKYLIDLHMRVLLLDMWVLLLVHITLLSLEV